ncbi:MAG: hypothetical protein ACJ8EB_12295 [Allosphingosinicella sp.]
MMRRLAFAAALLAWPAAGWGQTPTVGSGVIHLVGQAPSACVIHGPADEIVATNASYSPTGIGAGQIRITQMVDEAQAVGRAATIDLTLGVICNSPHRLVVRSLNGGLLREGAAAGAPGQGGFAEFVPYRVTAGWMGRELSGASDAGGGLTLDGGAGALGQLSVGIAIPGGERLLAGTYRDWVVVEFGAAE